MHLPLSTKDYKPFYKDCLICCNGIRWYEKEQIVRVLQSGKYELLPPLPSSILEKIKHGIAKSPAVPPKIKEKVLGTNNSD